MSNFAEHLIVCLQRTYLYFCRKSPKKTFSLAMYLFKTEFLNVKVDTASDVWLMSWCKCSKMKVVYGVLRSKHKRHWTKNTLSRMVYLHITFWLVTRTEGELKYKWQRVSRWGKDSKEADFWVPSFLNDSYMNWIWE